MVAEDGPAAGLVLRQAHDSDRVAVWRVVEPAIREGETYPLPRQLSEADALLFWFAPGHTVYVAERDGVIAGSYFVRPNQRGGGAHMANCGYVTAPEARRRGIAAAMCAHSLEQARLFGFRAMQFNFVVSTNEGAVRLWESFGFEIVGRIPEAFEHPRLGFVDALIMYRRL